MPREWRPARSWATGRSSRSEARSSGWKFPASACRSATKYTQEAGRTFTRARRTASSAAHWRSGAGTPSPTPPRPPRSSNGAPISSPRWRAQAYWRASRGCGRDARKARWSWTATCCRFLWSTTTATAAPGSPSAGGAHRTSPASWASWPPDSAASSYFRSATGPAGRNRFKWLVRGLDCLGGSLDELHYVVGVRDHGHVVGRDFDRGGPHTLGELALGSGRDGLIALGDQEPGGQRFPGRYPHHVLEGGRRHRLLHGIHAPGLDRVDVGREVVYEVVLRQPGEALLVDVQVRQCRGGGSRRQQSADRFALIKPECCDVDQRDNVRRVCA